MSSFKVEVVEVGPLVDHENADTLQITNVFDYPVIVKKGEFQTGDLAVYVPIDAVVPASYEWTWFHQGAQDIKHRRVKAKRLRGVFSMGLLVQSADLLFPVTLGDDVAELMGITKYEPPPSKVYNGSQHPVGREVPGFPKYTDIENLRRYPTVLQEGELVVITEKIHGANFRCGWWPVKCEACVGLGWIGDTEVCLTCNGAGQVMEFHVGSHSCFRKSPEEGRRCFACKGVGLRLLIHSEPFDQSSAETEPCEKCEGTGRLKDFHDSGASQNIWWRAVEKYDLKTKLEPWPGVFVFGEVYGDVQDLKYGAAPGEIDLRVFDIYGAGAQKYWSWEAMTMFADLLGLKTPPLIFQGPWTPALTHLAEGNSLLAPGQIREGFVVRPWEERWDHKCGRVILKAVSEAYLLRKGGTEGK